MRHLVISRSADLRPVLVVLVALVSIVAAGAALNRNFLSAGYLLQQLQIAAFLGVLAAGAMIVILLGHIDLSLPWTLTVAGMVGTAVAAGPGRSALAIPVGLACGLAIGVINGLGVAYLRIPAIIFTLGMNTVLQGLMVLLTGGFAPRTEATPAMAWLANGQLVPALPNPVLVWLLLSAGILVLLWRSRLGRYMLAVGNREVAVYLSGINSHAVIVACFAAAGLCSAIGGLLLSGYSGKAYQAMGDAYLLPAIAAVVLGGTSIQGGRGSYVGTALGAILIVLLQSVLSVIQMPEAGRQIIYGLVIVAMPLLYGRTVPA